MVRGIFILHINHHFFTINNTKKRRGKKNAQSKKQNIHRTKNDKSENKSKKLPNTHTEIQKQKNIPKKFNGNTMILSDKTLKKLLRQGLIKDNNYTPQQIQPSSIDLRINETITVPAHGTILASTIEYIKLPNKYAGRVEGRSSYGRLFIMIHSCAGFVDAGFEGNITLEIVNFNNKPYTFNKGDTVCQLVVEELDKECEKPYGHKDLNSHYQGQEGITKSYMENKE